MRLTVGCLVALRITVSAYATARVGYASQSAFTAALAREYGTTPRVIRREAHDKLRE